MAKYPVKSTSQSTYGRMERRERQTGADEDCGTMKVILGIYLS